MRIYLLLMLIAKRAIVICTNTRLLLLLLLRGSANSPGAMLYGFCAIMPCSRNGAVLSMSAFEKWKIAPNRNFFANIYIGEKYIATIYRLVALSRFYICYTFSLNNNNYFSTFFVWKFTHHQRRVNGCLAFEWGQSFFAGLICALLRAILCIQRVSAKCRALGVYIHIRI